MKIPAPVPIVLDRNGTAAASMVRHLQACGHEAYLAGGCVRDLILGRRPHDYDIATHATPHEILAEFPDAKAVGRAFPVVRLTRREQVVDIASFRQDGAYLDGRHPSETSPGTLEQDAERRDFTINALYLDPVTSTIVDTVNGLADLHQRTVRFVGDATLRVEEDHLRLMRAVRFSTTLGFTMDPETLVAIERHAPRLSRVSADRIRDELLRCLTEALSPVDSLSLLAESKVLSVILPDEPFDAKRLAHVNALLRHVETRLPELIIAILLHSHNESHGCPPHSQDVTRHTLEGLRFSNDFTETVIQTIALQEAIGVVSIQDVVNIRHLIANPIFPLALEMHRIEALATGHTMTTAHQLTALRNSMPQAEWLPSPWVTGTDLVSLGLSKGPGIAHWKRAAHDQQILGDIADREALLNWVRAAIQVPPSVPFS